MAGPNYVCPKCGFNLRPPHLRREGKPYFLCPSCNEKLRVSVAYRRFLLFGGIVISVALPFVLGIRDVLTFVVVAMLAFFPVGFLLPFLLRSIYPARFEPYSPEFIKKGLF